MHTSLCRESSRALAFIFNFFCLRSWLALQSGGGRQECLDSLSEFKEEEASIDSHLWFDVLGVYPFPNPLEICLQQ